MNKMNDKDRAVMEKDLEALEYPEVESEDDIVIHQQFEELIEQAYQLGLKSEIREKKQ